MQIVSIVGARPQFVKAAVLSRRLTEVAGVEETLIHTGQHYDQNLSDVFFEELEIPRPAFNLEVGSGSHGKQTGEILIRLEPILMGLDTDWLIVYGDTNSTVAAALAAAKLGIPIAHVEAGLRSFNRGMPEEINRVITDHLAEILFAPTDTAVRNLLNEGISEARIAQVGDIMFDASLFYSEKAQTHAGCLRDLGIEPGGYVLATVHRAENTGDLSRLRAILDGLAIVSREIPVVLPLHPRTRQAIAAFGLDIPTDADLKLIEPVGYLEMLALEGGARVVATDSGGVQKEAYFQRVPCVTLRDETEWVELVQLGWNQLVSPNSAEVVARAILQSSVPEQPRLEGAQGPYGDGDSASVMVQHLLSRLAR